MNCADLEAVLPGVLDGEVLEPAAAAHLQSCPGCRSRLEHMRQVWDALELGELPQASVTASAVDPAGGLPVNPPSGLPVNPPGGAAVDPVVASIHQDLRALQGVRRSMSRVTGLVGLLVVGLVIIFPRRKDLFTLPMMFGPGSALLFFVLAAVTLRQGLQLSGMMFRRGLFLLAGVAGIFFLHGSLSGALLPVEGRGAWLEAGRLGWQTGEGCLVSGVLMALPILGVVAWALRAARFPTVLSSLLLGASAGLAGAGVLQLHCSISSTQHLLMYHGGALAMTVALAGALGALIARGELRRTSSATTARNLY